MMGSGSWGGPGNDGSVPTHLSAWSKARLGWINVTNIFNTPRSYNIQNIESNSNAYAANNSVLVGQNEYFLLENRKQVGFDAYIPNQGIVIWHIDDGVINAYYADNTINGHSIQGVIPEYVSTVTDAPYLSPSKQYFNATTTPNSATNNGTATSVSIYVQSPIGTSMTVHFFGGNS